MIKQAKGCGERQRKSTRNAHRCRHMKHRSLHTNPIKTYTKTMKEIQRPINKPTNQQKKPTPPKTNKKQIQVYILTLWNKNLQRSCWVCCVLAILCILMCFVWWFVLIPFVFYNYYCFANLIMCSLIICIYVMKCLYYHLKILNEKRKGPSGREGVREDDKKRNQQALALITINLGNTGIWMKTE